jgi:hypothetical protein
MLYTILRGQSDITILTVHAPTEDKSDDQKDSFYEKLEPIINQFPKCHMKLC